MIVLGKSHAVITMICDNLESVGNFEMLEIINNLGIDDGRPFLNSAFHISESKDLSSTSSVNYMIGVYNPKAKKKVFNEFNIPMDRFDNVIHASVQTSSTIKHGNGILINSLVSIAAFSDIGNFVTINRNASIGHHTTIGDFSTINPGATICGNVKIGSRTSIGAGAVVIDGITIGSDCIIGAGSIVVKDIPGGSKGYGNPFRIVV